jgi:hypothetical protein
MNIRTSALVFFSSLGSVCLAACTGYIISPSPKEEAKCGRPAAQERGDAGYLQCTCPKISARQGVCSDNRIERALLICGGPEGALFLKVGNSRPEQPALGTTRFTVEFMEGSRFQGSLITPDPGCWLTEGTDIDFTFGAVYTGDQGEETDADGAKRQCIRQSKTVFSSFNFDLVGNWVHEGKMKARLHETIDSEIIKQLYPELGTNTGRCQQWRELP